MVYTIAVAFVDPAVFTGGEEPNFTAISIVFATLNVCPLIMMAFVNDSKLRLSARQLMIVLGASATGIGGTNKWHGWGSAFNELLGDAYSVVASEGGEGGEGGRENNKIINNSNNSMPTLTTTTPDMFNAGGERAEMS